MSIQQLPRPEVSGWVAAARDSVSSGAGVPVEALSDAGLRDAVEALASLESQVAAWRLELGAEAERRRVAEREGDAGTEDWLARLTGERRQVLSGGLRLARLLRERYPTTRRALADGRLRLDQVRVIVNAAEHAPEGVTDEQRAEAEETLIARATGLGTRRGRPLDAGRLRVIARRMYETISPAVADRLEAEHLAREERYAEGETWMTLGDRGDGTYVGRFVLSERHGRMLATALDRLSSPRRSEAWHLNGPERRGLAFLELIEHLPADGFDGNSATLLVTVPYSTLLDGLGAAQLDSGASVSPAAARHLACDAGIIPVVLGGRSLPLDLGRIRRLHTRAQRHALATHYRGCAAEGCERPFSWCEIHHVDPWSLGGRTDLVNAAPLCGFHHRRAHDGRLDARKLADGSWRFHRRT